MSTKGYLCYQCAFSRQKMGVEIQIGQPQIFLGWLLKKWVSGEFSDGKYVIHFKLYCDGNDVSRVGLMG